MLCVNEVLDYRPNKNLYLVKDDWAARTTGATTVSNLKVPVVFGPEAATQVTAALAGRPRTRPKNYKDEMLSAPAGCEQQLPFMASVATAEAEAKAVAAAEAAQVMNLDSQDPECPDFVPGVRSECTDGLGGTGSTTTPLGSGHVAGTAFIVLLWSDLLGSVLC